MHGVWRTGKQVVLTAMKRQSQAIVKSREPQTRGRQRESQCNGNLGKLQTSRRGVEMCSLCWMLKAYSWPSYIGMHLGLKPAWKSYLT